MRSRVYGFRKTICVDCVQHCRWVHQRPTLQTYPEFPCHQRRGQSMLFHPDPPPRIIRQVKRSPWGTKFPLFNFPFCAQRRFKSRNKNNAKRSRILRALSSSLSTARRPTPKRFPKTWFFFFWLCVITAPKQQSQRLFGSCCVFSAHTSFTNWANWITTKSKPATTMYTRTCSFWCGRNKNAMLVWIYICI